MCIFFLFFSNYVLLLYNVINWNKFLDIVKSNFSHKLNIWPLRPLSLLLLVDFGQAASGDGVLVLQFAITHCLTCVDNFAVSVVRSAWNVAVWSCKIVCSRCHFSFFCLVLYREFELSLTFRSPAMDLRSKEILLFQQFSLWLTVLALSWYRGFLVAGTQELDYVLLFSSLYR